MRYSWCSLMVHCLLAGQLTGQQAAAQQGLNNLWMFGYHQEDGLPWGAVDLEFGSGELVISQADRDVDFFRANTNITDAAGNLLFSTNGSYIANATGDTLQGGGGLNPSWYTSQYPEGHHVSQACLILPRPDTPGGYYLIHGTIDDPTPLARYLYLTTIDMGLDGGLGAVVTKNQVLIEDDLNPGKITAVRHANGRDWWVFCHGVNNNTFHRLLVTPGGVQVHGTQSLGIVRTHDIGQVCFSPDGTRFAYYWGDPTDLEVFRFDRCTGLFSDPVHIPIDDANSMGGVAFSPNSRYLYVSSVLDVYQYDVEAEDIAASMVHIAHWDGFYSPFAPFATMFDIAQLAPDGKVYIATGNSTLHLHVVHEPDQPGLACNMEQHGIELPIYYFNSLPNHPNYHLGPVDGSVCDSLGINVGMAPLSLEKGLGVRVYPNPCNGRFNLSYPAQPEAGLLEVLDATGGVVYRSRLSAWSQVHNVPLEGAAAGLYLCRVRWGAQTATTRVLLE